MVAAAYERLATEDAGAARLESGGETTSFASLDLCTPTFSTFIAGLRYGGWGRREVCSCIHLKCLGICHILEPKIDIPKSSIGPAMSTAKPIWMDASFLCFAFFRAHYKCFLHAVE